MARPTNTATRRIQIVKALSRVMAESGYDGATIQEIASKAGLTPGLLHYHFKSKLEILLELIDHLALNVEARFQKRMPRLTNPVAELEAFIASHLALGDDSDRNAVSCWIAIGAEALKDEQVKTRYQVVSERQILVLEEIVGRCLAECRDCDKSKRAIALGIFAAIEGSYRLTLAAPALIETGFATSTVLSMALGAIGANSGGV